MARKRARSSGYYYARHDGAGAVSPRHSHARSEQIWIVERGSGRLLTANGMSSDLNIGDVIRTPCGEIHGVENSGPEPFVYLTVTCPPEDMTKHYEARDTDMPATPSEARN